MLAVVLCCVLLLATVDVGESRYVAHTVHLLSARKTVATWEEADQICRSEGATLASPTDTELFKYMKAAIGVNNHTTAFFIGIKANHNSGRPTQFVSREGIPVYEMPDEVLNSIEQLDPIEGDCLCMTQVKIEVVPCLFRLPYFCYKNVTKHSVEDVTYSTANAGSYFPMDSSTLEITDSTTDSTDNAGTTGYDDIYSRSATAWTEVSDPENAYTTLTITDSTTDSTYNAGSMGYDAIYSTSETAWNEVSDPEHGYTTYYIATGSCYKYHQNERSWDDARVVCRSEGGDLAVINSGKEAEIVTNIMKNPFAWVGLRDPRLNNDWHSVDGDRIDQIYNVWRPNVIHGYECGVITEQAELDDYSCDRAFYFICEKKKFNNAVM